MVEQISESFEDDRPRASKTISRGSKAAFEESTNLGEERHPVFAV
jgi:hypothetical protein